MTYKTLKAGSEEALWDKIGDYTNNGCRLVSMPHTKWYDRSTWRAKVEVPKSQLEIRLEVEK